MNVFTGEHHIIPLANVNYVERREDNAIYVVMKGTQRLIDPNDRLSLGLMGSRTECPYLCGEEGAEFLRVWYRYCDLRS